MEHSLRTLTKEKETSVCIRNQRTFCAIFLSMVCVACILLCVVTVIFKPNQVNQSAIHHQQQVSIIPPTTNTSQPIATLNSTHVIQDRKPIITALLALTKTNNSKIKLFGDVINGIYKFSDYQKYNQLTSIKKDKLGLIMLLNKTNYFKEIDLNTQQKHHCDWEGIHCTEDKRVRAISFFSNRINLAGVINVNLIMENCNFLDKLTLINLKFGTNNVSVFINKLPKNLKRLHLSGIEMVGDLSKYVNQIELHKLSHLHTFSLKDTGLSSLDWSKLPKSLRSITLYWNSENFKQVELAHIPNVNEFHMFYQHMSGDILNELLTSAQFESLELIHCFKNRNVFTQYRDLHTFKQINWTANTFKKLKILDISKNDFTFEQMNFPGLISSLHSINNYQFKLEIRQMEFNFKECWDKYHKNHSLPIIHQLQPHMYEVILNNNITLEIEATLRKL